MSSAFSGILKLTVCFLSPKAAYIRYHTSMQYTFGNNSSSFEVCINPLEISSVRTGISCCFSFILISSVVNKKIL